MRVVRHIFLVSATMAWSFGVSGCAEDPAQPTGQAEAVEDSARERIEVSAEKIEASLAAAEEYLRADDVAKAQIILVRLIGQAPRDLRARELYGQACMRAAMYAEQRNDSKAASDYRQLAYDQYRVAVEIDPNSGGLRQSAAMTALTTGKQDEALLHFQAAGRLEPDNPQYPLFEAQILIQQRLFDAARSSLERVLAIDPDEAMAHASMAMIALELNEIDKALWHMSEARRIAPEDTGMRAQHARIYRRKGDPSRALELLVGLNEKERAQDVIAFELASSYAQLDDHIQAARAWQHCYTTDTMNPKAYLWAVRAGESLLKAQEREQASLWLQQAQAAAPNAPEVQALEAALRE